LATVKFLVTLKSPETPSSTGTTPDGAAVAPNLRTGSLTLPYRWKGLKLMTRSSAIAGEPQGRGKIEKAKPATIRGLTSASL
jgi:hypothetical protein